jgi:ornithine cyclodeaminase
MTRYVDVSEMARLVSVVGLPKMLEELAGYVRADYLRWEAFEKCPRVANHSVDGVIELMPASDETLYGFKYVNGHPKNAQHGLSTVMAFGVLAEVATGFPVLLSEMTIATAIRTAATSALAASVMARPDSKVMAIIGNGAQSEFQIIAFSRLLGIREFRIFDVDPMATAKLERNLASAEGINLVRCASTREAVQGADIITTVTADKALATILTRDMVAAGVHINGVGGDCPGKTEIEAAILADARVVVEYEPQSRIEGDLQQMPADFPVIELWEVLSGQKPGRASDEEITFFDSVGFAMEDFSTLRYIHDLAKEHGFGRSIDLVPEMSNPKDLFGLLPSAVAVPTAA